MSKPIAVPARPGLSLTPMLASGDGSCGFSIRLIMSRSFQGVLVTITVTRLGADPRYSGRIQGFRFYLLGPPGSAGARRASFGISSVRRYLLSSGAAISGIAIELPARFRRQRLQPDDGAIAAAPGGRQARRPAGGTNARPAWQPPVPPQRASRPGVQDNHHQVRPDHQPGLTRLEPSA